MVRIIQESSSVDDVSSSIQRTRFNVANTQQTIVNGSIVPEKTSELPTSQTFDNIAISNDVIVKNNNNQCSQDSFVLYRSFNELEQSSINQCNETTESEVVSEILSNDMNQYEQVNNNQENKNNKSIESISIGQQLLKSFSRMTESLGMRKPAYADCWIVGSGKDLQIMETYDMPGGKVVIGLASDGEIEYNLIPSEYSYGQELTKVIEDTIVAVRNEYRKKGGRMDRQSVILHAKEHICRTWSASDDVNWCLEDICDAVHRYVLGLGIFDILLSDERIEDIYVDAPSEKNRIHITMNSIEGFNTHVRCRTNLIAEQSEIKNLIGRLKKETGLPYCESSPVLETDMCDGDARATIVGFPLSPNGDSVAIRKHSSTPWTLTRLIANGTVDSRTAGILSFLVENRSSIIVCGARGAGKSSLLSALMFEFPLSQRILTIEDTIELPAKKMRGLGYKVQTMLIDDRMSGNAESRAGDALRVSLRLGESAIVLGEVRGDEAKTLYQSMRTGKAGSSIMGTMHGDSAKTVYERVVHDMGISPEAFMATDFLVTLGMVKEKGKMRREVSEIVSTSDTPGDFIDVSGEELISSPAIKRIMSSCSISVSELEEEISARSGMRALLAEYGKIHGDKYYGPEWIVMANNHLSEMLNDGPLNSKAVITSFESKLVASLR